MVVIRSQSSSDTISDLTMSVVPRTVCQSHDLQPRRLSLKIIIINNPKVDTLIVF